MGVQEIEIEEDFEEEAKADYKQLLARYEKEVSFLRLAENPNITKWLEKFVLIPLEKLEVAHDIEVDTNKNFILKGQCYRMKKLANWVEIHKKKCDTIKLRLETMGKGH